LVSIILKAIQLELEDTGLAIRAASNDLYIICPTSVSFKGRHRNSLWLGVYDDILVVRKPGSARIFEALISDPSVDFMDDLIIFLRDYWGWH